MSNKGLEEALYSFIYEQPNGVMRTALQVLERVNGVILWRGASLINGEPVVAIGVGLRRSKNTKTGDFVQVYILFDGEEKPTDAINSGKDESVCGSCIHRKKGGLGSCYVNVGQGPNQVYAAYKRDSYPEATSSFFDGLTNRKIRLGAYGDPAAIPVEIWERLTSRSAGWTGYTHQWRKCDLRLRDYVMASVESEEGQKEARKRGWKTFRVRNEDEPLTDHEFICPASKEGGRRMQCEGCMACHGGEWNGKQVTPVIKVHGAPYKVRRFNKRYTNSLEGR